MPPPAAPLAAPASDRFDLELRDADVHAALRMLAEVGKADLVVPDTVYGKVNLRLRDVTWDTAFYAVLAVEGLTAAPVGGVLRVGPR